MHLGGDRRQPQGPFIDRSTAPLECQRRWAAPSTPPPSSTPTVALPGVEVGRSGLRRISGPSNSIRRARRSHRAPPHPSCSPPDRPGRPGRSRHRTSSCPAGTISSSIRATTGTAPTTPSASPPVAAHSGRAAVTSPDPILSSGPGDAGPGGESVFIDTAGKYWIAFHAWVPGAVGFPNSRGLYLRRLSLSGATPRSVAPPRQWARPGTVRIRAGRTRIASASKAAAASLLTRGPGARHRVETVGGREGVSAATRAPARRRVGRPAASQCEVGGDEPLGRAAPCTGGRRRRGTRGQLGSPVAVRRAHGDDEIETPGAQHRRVDGGDGVRRHDHQAPGSGFEDRQGLQQSFTIGWLSGRVFRAEAISSASSMKQTKRSTGRDR